LKVLIDENLTQVLARTLNLIVGIDDHEVIHALDIGKGTPDLELFERAIQAGVKVHITQDHHHRRLVQKEAIARLGLTVFVLAPGWNDMDHYRKAAWLIEWWPKIMQMAELTEPGSIFVVPARAARNGRLKPPKR
jgi:hypothetical protein